MSDQALIMSAFVVRQSRLLFRDSKNVLDVPACERYSQHAPKAPRELVGHEILHFSCRFIDGRD